MAKKMLRLLEGTKLPEELSEKWKARWPGHEIKEYVEKRDYRENIKRRIESLHKAFYFVLEAYPPNRKDLVVDIEFLKKQAEDYKATCKLDFNSLDELQKELQQYTRSLMVALLTAWDWPSLDPQEKVKQAIACLNEIEQCMLLFEGRPEVLTCTEMSHNGEKKYIVFCDKSIPAYNQLLIDELKAVQSCKNPLTPYSFRTLQKYQQAYFLHFNLTIKADNPLQTVKEKVIEPYRISKVP